MNLVGPCGFDTWKFERIKGRGAIVKKDDVSPGPPGMASIDPFVLAVQDPKTVEHSRHSGHDGGPAEFIYCCLAVIQGNTGERPNFRASGRAVYTIPAIAKPLRLPGRSWKSD